MNHKLNISQNKIKNYVIMYMQLKWYLLINLIFTQESTIWEIIMIIF